MKSFVKLDVAAIRSFSKDHRLGSIQDQPKMSFVSTHKLSTMSSKQQQRAPRVHDQMRHKKKKSFGEKIKRARARLRVEKLLS